MTIDLVLFVRSFCGISSNLRWQTVVVQIWFRHDIVDNHNHTCLKSPHVGGVTVDTATKLGNAILQRLPWTSSQSSSGVRCPFLSYSLDLIQRYVSELPRRHQIRTRSRGHLVSDHVFYFYLLFWFSCLEWTVVVLHIGSWFVGFPLKLVEVKHVKSNFLLWKRHFFRVLKSIFVPRFWTWFFKEVLHSGRTVLP